MSYVLKLDYKKFSRISKYLVNEFALQNAIKTAGMIKVKKKKIDVSYFIKIKWME